MRTKSYPLAGGTLTISHSGNVTIEGASNYEATVLFNRVEFTDKTTGEELLCIIFTSRKSYIVVQGSKSCAT